MNNLLDFNSKIGIIRLKSYDNKLFRLDFVEKIEYVEGNQFLRGVQTQVEEYLNGLRKDFQVDFHLEGTEFQRSVWMELTRIPYGETRSYKDIALAVNSPKAYRAVGMANNKNPIGIIIPCHRVIGANGKLVGYNGGLDIKEKLLNLENDMNL